MRPLSRPSPIAIVWSCQRIERCGQHQLQVAFGQYHVTVFEAQDFTLLGDAQLSLKTVERLRVDGAVCRPTASPDRTAAAMKEPQMHAARPRHLVQRTVGSIDLPRAGQHPAIFVRVGITKHQLLRVVP